METPAHDNWDPARHKEKGQAIEEEIRGFIRECLRAMTKSQEGGKVEIPGLHRYLPFEHEDDDTQTGGTAMEYSGRPVAGPEETARELGAAESINETVTISPYRVTVLNERKAGFEGEGAETGGKKTKKKRKPHRGGEGENDALLKEHLHTRAFCIGQSSDVLIYQLVVRSGIDGLCSLKVNAVGEEGGEKVVLRTAVDRSGNQYKVNGHRILNIPISSSSDLQLSLEVEGLDGLHSALTAMRYNNRDYPHPVLGVGDAVAGHFSVRLAVRAGTKEIRLEPVYDLGNRTPTHPGIEGGQAQFATHIYCKGTMFREVRKSTKAVAETIVLPASALRDKVEVDFFVCANAPIAAYTNSDAHSDFVGHSFPVERGVILAYGGQGVFYANKTPEELKAISSFMNIDRDPRPHGPMYNAYDGDKITVMLSSNDYQRYQIVKRDPYIVEILHSAIVLPALMQAIAVVQEEPSEFAEHKWFDILKGLVEETKEEDPMKIAQKILENPLNRSFNAVTSMMETAD
ncbi:MAG: hypothetical protein IPM46_11535 [Flavobacteriales bacterium]|nr:hypothetical protein [Flavobacteriales bacterium]